MPCDRPTLNVTLLLTLASWLTGCTLMMGDKITVNVAFPLVTPPATLLTLTAYVPASLACALAML